MSMMKKCYIFSLFAFCILSIGCTSEYQSIHHKNVFPFACEESGGVYQLNDDRCHCSGIVCDKSVICDEFKSCRTGLEAKNCTKGLLRCENSRIFECNDNKEWIKHADTPENCIKYGCLSDNTDCAECNANACFNGQISYCENGKFSKVENCKQAKCANETTCFRECEDGEVSCQASNLRTCIDGGFKQTSCPYGCEETVDGKPSKACATSCKENSKICSNGNLQVCVGGTYSKTESCENGYSCKNNTECGVCEDGSSMCKNDENAVGQFSTCVKGEWSESLCPNDSSCQSDFQCGVCNNNEPSCKDDLNGIGQLTTCVGGVEHTEICPGQASCQNASECGECKNNDKRCADNEKKTGVLSVCNNGKYQNVAECDNGYSCENKTECGKCINDTTICENVRTDFGRGNIVDIGHVEKCVNGGYGDSEDCLLSSCDPSKTKCGDCITGQKLCSDDRSMILDCLDGEFKENECNEGLHCQIDFADNVVCVAN